MSEVAGQVMLIVGPSGVGKSNGRVQWIVKEFLSDPENGGLVTNLPLDVEAIREYYDGLFAQGKAVCTGDDVASRILKIPPATLELWKIEREDPFRFFEDVPFQRFRVVIDEIGDYYGVQHSKEWQASFQNFLDQCRHLGDGGIELITQTVDKLPRQLKSSVEVRVDCVGCKVRRDGAFNIPYYDWYQLKAIVTGEVVLSCFYIEMINIGGAFKKNNERKALLNQQSFRFYNSHGAVEGSEREGKAETFPFQRYGRWGTVLWFVKKNWPALIFSYGGLAVFAFVLFQFYTFGDLLIDAKDMLKNKMRPPSLAAEKTEKKPAAGAVEEPPPLKSIPPAVEAYLQPVAVPELKAFSVHLLDDSGAVVEGVYYGVGETVEGGALDSAELESVDVSRGVVRTSRGVGRLPARRAQAPEVEAAGRTADDGRPGSVPRTVAGSSRE